jgi:hypothetical protein
VAALLADAIIDSVTGTTAPAAARGIALHGL